MNNFKNAIVRADENALEGLILAALDRMFVVQAKNPVKYYEAMTEIIGKVGKNAERRSGLHASALIKDEGSSKTKTSFCYREQVMQFYFDGEAERFGTGTRRIFLEGWNIHVKWQSLFTMMGYAVAIEEVRQNAKYELFFTPDAIIKLLGKVFVVEIKSMRTELFRKLKEPPKEAVRQVRLYMNELDEELGIVLVEDKNDQNFKIWIVGQDEAAIKRYSKRMRLIRKARQIYEDEGRLPKRICQSKDDKRAQACPLREACFKQQ